MEKEDLPPAIVLSFLRCLFPAVTIDCLAESRCHTKVAGVSHVNGDGSHRQEIIARCSVGERLNLQPEPSNRYDPNAVKVCRGNGEHSGYLSAYLAADIASEMEDGDPYYAVITDLTGGTAAHTTRGVNIEIFEGSPRGLKAEASAVGVLKYGNAIQKSFLDGYVSSAELSALRELGAKLSAEQVKAAHALVFANVLRTGAIDECFTKDDETMAAAVRKVLDALGWCP